MTQLLNDYLNSRSFRELLVPGTVWKDKENKFLMFVISIKEDTVYYKYQKNGILWDIGREEFLQHLIMQCEIVNDPTVE